MPLDSTPDPTPRDPDEDSLENNLAGDYEPEGEGLGPSQG